MKIIDGFTFYNELDMLLYRLSVLDDIVDYFIIVEATKTHAGKDKILYYEENKHLYEKFAHKIIHIIDEELIVPDITKDEQWNNEIHQRNEIKKGLEFLDLFLTNDDILIISDLDEIPDTSMLRYLKENNKQTGYSALAMDFYYYNLNCKIQNEKWYSARIINYGLFKNLNLSCNEVRMSTPENVIENGGWHLSYFGDGEFIKNKLQNFAHQEFNNEKYTNIETINNCIENYYNIFEQKKCHRYVKIPIAENNYLPPLYDTLLTKYIRC